MRLGGRGGELPGVHDAQCEMPGCRCRLNPPGDLLPRHKPLEGTDALLHDMRPSHDSETTEQELRKRVAQKTRGVELRTPGEELLEAEVSE